MALQNRNLLLTRGLNIKRGLILTIFLFSFSGDSETYETRFHQVFNLINDHSDLVYDREAFFKTALNAGIKSADPYGVYLDSAQTNDRGEVWKGYLFGGIGINLLEDNGHFFVSTVNETGPAFRNGVKPGQEIAGVNGKPLKGMALADLVKLLRGEVDSSLTLDLIGWDQKRMTSTIKRERIYQPAVFAHGKSTEGEAYIRLIHFMKGSAIALESRLKQLLPAGKIVLDLRGNSGGLVEEAVSAAGLFTSAKKDLLFLKGRKLKETIPYPHPGTVLDTITPLEIWVDANTISSGELFASILQDLDRAVVKGDTTHGKGVVQATRFTTFHSSVYITVGQYYSPAMRCIHKGLKEKYTVKSTVKKRELPAGRGVVPDVQSSIPPVLWSIVDLPAFFFTAHSVAAQPPVPAEKLRSTLWKQWLKKLETTDITATAGVSLSSAAGVLGKEDWKETRDLLNARLRQKYILAYREWWMDRLQQEYYRITGRDSEWANLVVKGC